MAPNIIAPDYYAVLQVHPDADREVIEAAYRQLMRKYHPDMAGGDTVRAAALHERAKAINQAYAVLRDPAQRRIYDGLYNGSAVHYGYPDAREGYETAREPPPPASADPAQVPTPPNEASGVPEVVDYLPPALLWAPVRVPLAALSSLFYLLPGPYEWEPGGHEDLIVTLLFPPLGIVSWALASGRLNSLLGRSPYGFLAAWAVLLVLSLPAWQALPRLVLAAAPTVLLFMGNLDGVLHTVNVPTWLAGVILGIVSLLLSGRLYVFAVLPTIGLCWLLTRIA